ncbi:MAG: YbjQ family protein [Lysobacterales bacterium]
MAGLLIVTTDFVAGKKIDSTLGVARGSTIRTKHVGKDFMAGLRTLVGGELKEYSEMLVESRAQALSRMEEQALKMGADAVVGVRFVTSQVMAGAAELLAYGTAVTLSDEG